MKKILLCMIGILMMTGCSKKTDTYVNTTTIASSEVISGEMTSNEVEMTVNEETKESVVVQSKYTECDVIDIIGYTKVFSSSSLAKSTSFAFTSNSDKNIKDIVLYIAYFDNNKMMIGNSYVTAEFKSANIVKGSTKVYRYPNNDNNYAYINFLVGKIVYEDGTTWELDHPDEWINEIVQNKEKMIANCEMLKTKYAEMALGCNDYSASGVVAEIDITKAPEHVVGGDYNLSIKLTNNGSKKVEKLSIRIAFYKEGKTLEAPVYSSYMVALKKDDANNDGRFGNVIRLNVVPQGSIEHGQVYDESINYFLEDGDVEVKYIIDLVKYEDGSIWVNNNSGMWSSYYSYYRE